MTAETSSDVTALPPLPTFSYCSSLYMAPLVCSGHPELSPVNKALSLPLFNPIDRHGRVFVSARFGEGPLRALADSSITVSRLVLLSMFVPFMVLHGEYLLTLRSSLFTPVQFRLTFAESRALSSPSASGPIWG